MTNNRVAFVAEYEDAPIENPAGRSKPAPNCPDLAGEIDHQFALDLI
jgi:hypothetical protein